MRAAARDSIERQAAAKVAWTSGAVISGSLR
jgi:hypothetical protein